VPYKRDDISGRTKCQISFDSIQVSFRFHSQRCSEIRVSPSICTKIRTWRFHRTKEVSNNFCVSLHITHISMAISANLGRDTEHNSTKLVRFHPLGAVWCSTVQCVAVCCSVLQCVAVCCSVLQHMNTSHPTPSSL